MPFPRPALPALLFVALGAGAAWSQQSLIAPGSLPPPRPLQPAAPAAPPPNAAQPGTQPAPRPAQAAPAPTPSPTPAPRPPQTLQLPQGQSQGQSQPPAAAQPRPAQSQGQQPRPQQGGQQGQRPPQGQAQRPPQGQAPTVGGQQPPQNRRPAAAAAAGAAAGVAAGAAGAAAAAGRTPEPAQPVPATPPPPPPPSTGTVSGLPIPRFASLRSDQVNMRVGPNTTFPIEWTFQRRDLPVMIVGEFQVWRRIRDVDGAEGWVHQSTLAGRRTALVQPPANVPEVALRRRPEDGAATVARLRPGVIARIRECEASSPWCEVQVTGIRGYIKRSEVWGVMPEEEVKS